MRFLAAIVLGAVLAAGSAARSQETLDPNPTAWRGVAMGPEQLFEGDYTIDYQTSVFKAPGVDGDGDWLAGWDERPGENGGLVRRYHIRFVGRRTSQPGRYGPLGRYAGEVLITRLISARLLIDR